MTNSFINLLFSIKKEFISTNLFKQVRCCLVDYLAVTLAGSNVLSGKLLTYVKNRGIEGFDGSIIGLNCKADIQTVALLNGMSSHVIELDDGHRQGAIHVGGTIFSALLAIAEKENLTSEDFYYGAIIGYEASIRLACAVQPGNKMKGYHATSTCGTLGATMAIGAALHFDQEQMKSALSAAVTCSAGVLEMQEDNSDYKPLNVGRAAMDAISAAYLGKARFSPPYDAIGGKRGFLRLMTDTPQIEYLTDFNPNQPLAITRIYMKTYAACRHTHPAIEAALYLRKQDEFDIENINSIVVEAYKLAVAGHDHTDILGISSAKMSLPFSVALALVKGGAGMDDFCTDNVSDKKILDLTKKVTVIENEELSSWVPNKRASILHLYLNDGQCLTHQVDYPKGEPENPLSEEELLHKFYSLVMNTGKTRNECDQIVKMIYQESFELKDLLSLI